MSASAGERSPINAVAWFVWLAGTAALPLVSRNPFYLFLAFVVVIFVHISLPPREGSASSWKLFAYIGSFVAVLAIAFNVLTVHVGDRVFARLPEWLPIIGGNLTLNAFVYGVSSALAISTLLFAAATFNSAIRHGDLIRILPASFSRFGIAGSIALTFVPQTMSAGRDIYDAQRARGHRFRRPRDTRAFALPLLGVSLERAMVLSEALETRGFGSSTSRSSRSRLSKVALAVGGFSLIAALVFIAIGDLILGLSMVIATLVCVLAGRPSTYRRTRLRTMVWNVPSVAVAIAAMVPVGLVLANIITGFSLAFEPFPVLEMPDFSALAGLAIACLLTPAIWSRR